MSDPTKELIFQNEVIAQMIAGERKCGDAENYDHVPALYPEDVVRRRPGRTLSVPLPHFR